MSDHFLHMRFIFALIPNLHFVYSSENVVMVHRIKIQRNQPAFVNDSKMFNEQAIHLVGTL